MLLFGDLFYVNSSIILDSNLYKQFTFNKKAK